MFLESLHERRIFVAVKKERLVLQILKFAIVRMLKLANS